jgi:hypothetical protein
MILISKLSQIPPSFARVSGHTVDQGEIAPDLYSCSNRTAREFEERKCE